MEANLPTLTVFVREFNVVQRLFNAELQFQRGGEGPSSKPVYENSGSRVHTDLNRKSLVRVEHVFQFSRLDTLSPGCGIQLRVYKELPDNRIEVVLVEPCLIVKQEVMKLPKCIISL